jgi:uncharacterized protein (DUF952 family)
VAGQRGLYEADTLATEGFIHCSEPHQVVDTANVLFRGRPDLVLLVIDPTRLDAPLRYEASKRGTFPHIYGPLNVSAVTAVLDFPPGPRWNVRASHPARGVLPGVWGPRPPVTRA